MNRRSILAGLGAVASITCLLAPTPAHAASGQVYAWLPSGSTGYGSFVPNGDQLVVDDYTPAGGWRVRASVQKYNSGKDAWQALFSCTAKEGQSVPTKCAQDIPEGTLVRVHVWMYEGSNTKWDAYSATTHA